MDCSICSAMPFILRPPRNTICGACYEGARSIINLTNKLDNEKGLDKNSNTAVSSTNSSKGFANALKCLKEMREIEEELNEKLSFLSGFVTAFREQIHADILVKPGNNGPPIPAHRALLAARSDIFKNMLDSDGCKAPPDDTITLEELDYEELESLLEFLYSGNLPKDKVEKHVYSLSIAADKYEIPFLQKFCEHQMLGSLSSSNVLDVLEISDTCSNQTLRETALNFIVKNMEDVVFSGHDAASQQCMLADCYLQLNSKSKAADAYFDAGKFFMKTNAPNVEDAILCFLKASSLSLEPGRFNKAANCYKEIGDLHERNNCWGLANAFFQKAADNFSKEKNQFLANKCRLKIAEFAAQFGDYPKAIHIYEDLARQEVSNYYNLKEHYLDAAICHLCNGDLFAVDSPLVQYMQHHDKSLMEDEFSYLTDLADVLGDESVVRFSRVVDEFSTRMQLTPRRTLLLKDKVKSMEEDIKRRRIQQGASDNADNQQ